MLQRANAKNQNGRVYPREILERESGKYTKEFVKQIYRQADFITTMMLSKESMETLRDKKEFQSSLRIKEACSAFLNDEDVEPHVDKFLRKEVELKTYEEMEIWGKFTPPEQFIQYDDVYDK